MQATTFATLFQSKQRAQARIGDARQIALDVSPCGVFVGYWMPRQSGKGSAFDFHTGALSFDEARQYLNAL